MGPDRGFRVYRGRKFNSATRIGRVAPALERLQGDMRLCRTAAGTSCFRRTIACAADFAFYAERHCVQARHHGHGLKSITRMALSLEDARN